ncbi:hypothetical protein ANABIO32_02150 [Rossellomorea marisflavi]|uniref:hypothetical protein n=1 Tax=Rossellomorea marisflavi TaxID=189381 RepID=UPI0025CAAEEB|nr:hypothetical protein [Rossellomorea marisflavi]GLI82528.1 hypothetical protein ANABIO32_02150 [Rossellomorea marisflavi]
MKVNTKTFKVGSKVYCSYCGEKAKEEWSWSNHRPDKHYFTCSCEASEKEKEFYEQKRLIKLQAERDIDELKSKLPQPDKKMIEDKRYQFKLYNLNKKYNKLI